MAHKTFTDSSGVEWFVFDVMPRADERRNYDRRRDSTEQPPDDRRAEDRRVTVGQRPPRLTKGWLCFERDGERRRLQPIPDRWSSLDDVELEKLVASASIAPVRKRTHITRSEKQG